MDQDEQDDEEIQGDQRMVGVKTKGRFAQHFAQRSSDDEKIDAGRVPPGGRQPVEGIQDDGTTAGSP